MAMAVRQFRLRSSLPTLAVLIGTVILSTALPARADVGMQIVVNGSTLFNSTSTGATLTTTTPLTNAGLTITASSVTSNSPGQSTPIPLANLLGSALALDNAGGSGAQSVTITYSANNFTTPTVPPLAFVSQLGGAINAVFGTSSTMTYQSWVNSGNNALFATTGTGQLTSGPQTVSLPGIGGFTVPNFAGTITTALTAPYSITGRATIVLASQGPLAGQFNWANNTSVTGAIPEPSSYIMLGMGVIGGSLGFVRRHWRRAD